MNAPCWIVRWWQRITSPVPQNTLTAAYGRYKGYVVPKVPVIDDERPWLVKEWVDSPDHIKAIDEMLAEKEKSDGGQAEPAEQDDSDQGMDPAAVAVL